METTYNRSLSCSRSDCFTSPYFKRCVDALLLQEKKSLYDEMVSALAGEEMVGAAGTENQEHKRRRK